MRELSKLAKFFIICGIVFVVGIVCTVAGAAMGGPQDIEKLADRYDWIQGEPGERGVTSYPVEEFHSVAVTGDCDVWLVGKSFYKNASRMAQDDLLTSGEMDLIEENKVLVIAGDKVVQPEITVSEGVLTINAGPRQETSGISLSSGSWTPQILVCCPMDPLESLSVSNDYSDLTCLGTAWKNADIQTNSGYTSMEGVDSAGLSLETESGDCELEGSFVKTTSLKTESGDVKISTSLAKEEYGLNLGTGSGDIELDGEEAAEGADEEDFEEDGSKARVQINGGPHTISAETESGDISIAFGK